MTLYVYRWNRPEGAPRKGQLCRVTARGAMNFCRVEFADGFAMITSRNAVRREKPAERTRHLAREFAATGGLAL